MLPTPWLRFARALALSLFVSAVPAVALASPWPELSGESGRAHLEQHIAPALQARALAATARADALRAVLDGQASIEAAVPELAALDLAEPAVIAGRLRALDGAIEAREAERAAIRGLGDQALRSNAAEAVSATHEREDAADGLERRLLLALRGFLRGAPWATADGADALVGPLDARIVAARDVDEADAATLADAVEAAEDRAEVRALIARLRDAAIAGGSPIELEPAMARLAEDPARDGALLVVGLLHEAATEPQREVIASALAAAGEARATLSSPVGPGDYERAAAVAPAPLGAVLREEAARAASAEASAVASDATTTLVEAEQARLDSGAAAAATARLIEARVPAERRLEELRAATSERFERFEARYDEVREELARARDTFAAVKGDPRSHDIGAIDDQYRLLPGRLAALRAHARALDVELAELQAQNVASGARIEDERTRIREETASLSRIGGADIRERRVEALRRWSEVLDEEQGLLRERLETLQQARDRVLALIPEVAEVRAAGFGHISREARSEDRGNALIEIADELSMVGPTYLATVRARWLELRADFWWWLDLRVLSGLVLGSLSLLVGVVLWLVIRRQTGAAAAFITRYIERTRRIGAQEIGQLRPSVNRVLVTAVDVLGALLLLRVVPEGLPELSVLLLLLFEVQLLRLTLSTFDLAVARRPTIRPALVRMQAEAWRLARRTVLLVAVWVAVRRVLLAFAHDLIAGFATEYFIRLLLGWALVVVAIGLLYAWAPHLRRRVELEVQDGPLVRWLGSPPPAVIGGFLLAGPQALGALAVLAFFRARRLVFALARRGSGSRWTNALDVLRFGRPSAATAGSKIEPLPAEVRGQLIAAFEGDLYIERPKPRDALLAEIREWRDDDRQGLIALLGDAGEGIDAALAHWRPGWETEGLHVRRVEIDRRLSGADDAYAWLQRAFDLPETPTSVDGAAALLAAHLPPGVLHVDRMNLAFLRTVGGFDALRTLLEVFHADGFDRCWLLALYRPAWRYLERLGTSANIHLVRAVIDLGPLTAADLRELVEQVASQAGLEIDYHELVRAGALTGAVDEELRHAIDAYYRLLATASAGNPSVAVGLWIRSIEFRDGALLARVTDTLRGVSLPELGDDHLFVLAALRTHRTLGEAEMASVLNVGLAQVRALVRQMVSLDLIERQGDQLDIRLLRLPAVTSLLRRRHFIHWS